MVDKERIIKAFDIFTKDNDYRTSIGEAATLLAFIIDESERINESTPRRIEVVVASNSDVKYKVIVEELE